VSLVQITCGGGGGGDPDARPPADAAVTPGPIARFTAPTPGDGADWGALPFPSDLFVDADGGLAIGALPTGDDADPSFVAMLAEGLHALDGAPVRASAYFPIDGAIDPATLVGHVHLVELPGLAEIPIDTVWRADLGTVIAAPRLGTVLREKTTYGAYLTVDVADPDGRPLERSPDFAVIADLGAVPADAALAAAQESVEPLLTALGEDADRVAVATVFRTETVSDPAVAMRDLVAATPPTATADVILTTPEELETVFGVQAPDQPPGMLHNDFRAQPHGHVGALIHGVVSLASFTSPTPGVDGFVTYDEGVPVIKGYHPAKYTLILPQPPGGSYADLPVVIYIGGINRTRIDMLVQADTAAARGFATLAIDIAHHGDRSTSPVDEVNDMTGVLAPDGFGDLQGLSPAVNFFHLVASGGIPAYHPLAMRDNLRQAGIDICSLVSFVVGGDLTPLATLLDGAGLPDDLGFRDDVAIVTESFGALISGLALAVEPHVTAASYSSPAAGFPFPSMIHSPNYSATFLGAITIPFDVGDRIVLGDAERGARLDPLVMLYDGVIDSGEVLGFAPYILGGSLRGGVGPDLLITESWSDEWVSNDTQEHLAGILGVPRVLLTADEQPPAPGLRYVALAEVAAPLSGNLAGGAQTAGLALYHPSPHAVLRKLTDELVFEPGFPPFVERETPVPIDPTPMLQIHAQWSTFLAEHFAGQVPHIIDPYDE
jgi:hypothetical protein